MGESPAAVVSRLFDRIREEGVEAALGLVAPDAVLIVPPEASAEPDTYEGHDGTRRYFAGFDGVLDDVRFDLSDVEEVSDVAVIASLTMTGRGAATGIPVAQTVFLAVTVRDGLVARMAPRADRESALGGVEWG
jgi:ketosteroid isomerase-like protein